MHKQLLLPVINGPLFSGLVFSLFVSGYIVYHYHHLCTGFSISDTPRLSSASALYTIKILFRSYLYVPLMSTLSVQSLPDILMRIQIM